MKLLAVDTSTNVLSLALCDADKILVSKNLTGGRKISLKLVPAIESLLKKVGLKPKAIDGFVVGIGPGSFTSLRVGLSAMKAMSYSLNKPLVGICSMDALALQAPNGEVAVVMDAKRQLLYFAKYEKNKTGIKQIGEYLLTDIQSVLKNVSEDVVFTGDGVAVFKDQLKGRRVTEQRLWKPQAKFLLKLAQKRFELKKYDDVDSLVPLYLYKEDCQVTVKK